MLSQKYKTYALLLEKFYDACKRFFNVSELNTSFTCNWKKESPCPMIISWNILIVSRHAVKVIFISLASDRGSDITSLELTNQVAL